MAKSKRNVPAGLEFFELGKAYLIRTVTNYFTGRIKEITPLFITLEDAAWIACTGRFHQCVTTGSLDEVEPYASDVAVSVGTIVDATAWPVELPRIQK